MAFCADNCWIRDFSTSSSCVFLVTMFSTELRASMVFQLRSRNCLRRIFGPIKAPLRLPRSVLLMRLARSQGQRPSARFHFLSGHRRPWNCIMVRFGAHDIYLELVLVVLHLFLKFRDFCLELGLRSDKRIIRVVQLSVSLWLNLRNLSNFLRVPSRVLTLATYWSMFSFMFDSLSESSKICFTINNFSERNLLKQLRIVHFQRF